MVPINVFAALIPMLLIAAAELRAGGISFSDVEFGHPGGYSLKMDADVPEGDGPFPAVVIVHGGAWVTGDRKRSVEPLFSPLANAGLAWFSISYRMANMADPKSTPTLAASAALLGGAVDDVRSAVAYIRTHASDYHIDPDRIALIGESAGAQLAAMAALRPGQNGAVKAVVAFYCPSDLVTLVQTMPLIPDSLRRAVQGTPFEGILLAYLRELSPINWVRENAPPFLLIHGTADQIVPFQQSVDLCAAMHKSGSACELYPVEGAGHGLRWWESANRMTAYKKRMVDWLTQELTTSKAQ
ncbi:MAG: alpha/beta hydrolase [Bryobacteraceae bacterium]